MPAVAAWKWRNHAAITDAQREQAVIEHAATAAESLGLAPDGVRELFALQIRIARHIQESLHERWRAQGFDDSAGGASLESDLRPRLDFLTTSLLRALYLAAPYLEHPQLGARHASQAERQLRAAGWSPENRRELLLALAAIRRKAAPALPRIAAARVLRIGLTGDYAPFSLESNGALTGADVELTSALAKSLDAEPVFVRTSWASLLEDLHTGRFDIAAGGISVTPAREAVAAFSIPYASGGKTAIARCRDADEYGSLAAIDRSAVRIVVNPGGTNEQYVRANVHRAIVLVHEDNRTIFEEIRAGRADVMITDDVEVELQIRRHSDLCRVFAGTLTLTDKALLMPRDSEFVAAVNAWLTQAVAAGLPARLLRQHLHP